MESTKKRKIINLNNSFVFVVQHMTQRQLRSLKHRYNVNEDTQS